MSRRRIWLRTQDTWAMLALPIWLLTNCSCLEIREKKVIECLECLSNLRKIA